MTTTPESNSLRTYKSALLQIVAYKKLQSKVNATLKYYDLNTTQWIILGELYEHRKGLRTTDLANILHVEVPLITIVTQPLVRRRHITVEAHIEDKRAKLLKLTRTARHLVEQIESNVRMQLSKALRSISPEELTVYFKVLRTIIRDV